jgi:L-cysteate sulfo-lyase
MTRGRHPGEPPRPGVAAAALLDRLDQVPRIALAHLPTPIESLSRLSRHLGGPTIWVKREDCTGLGLGGNKVRKLELILADALAEGADTVVSGGVVQSNHARQVAAAAAKLGLACHLALMTGRVPRVDPDYDLTGNIFLDRLFGARCVAVDWRADRNVAIRQIVDELIERGRRPYFVPYGGSNRLGTLAFVRMAAELQAQVDSLGVRLDAVVHASGTGGTQAGLLIGLGLLAPSVEVIGVDVDAEAERVRADVTRLAADVADFLDVPDVLTRHPVEVVPEYAGDNYGIPTPGTIEAIALAAQLEGLVLDPVYSGKGLAGLIGMIRQGRFGPGQHVLYVHTGGAPGLFAYRSAFPTPAD